MYSRIHTPLHCPVHIHMHHSLHSHSHVLHEGSLLACARGKCFHFLSTQSIQSIQSAQSSQFTQYTQSTQSMRRYAIFTSSVLNNLLMKQKIHDFLIKHNMYPPKEKKVAFAAELQIDWFDLNESLKEYRRHLRNENIPTSQDANRTMAAHLGTGNKSSYGALENTSRYESDKYKRLRVLVSEYIVKKPLSNPHPYTKQQSVDTLDDSTSGRDGHESMTETHSVVRFDDTPIGLSRIEPGQLWKVYFPPQIINSFAREVGLSAVKVKRAIRKLVIKGKVTRAKKEHLKEWLTRNNIAHEGRPNEHQIEELVDMLQLSKYQIHTLIDRMQDKKSKLTSEKLSIIRNAFHQHGTNLLGDPHFLQKLIKQTNLGKFQIRNLIFRLRDKMEYSNKKVIPAETTTEIYNILKASQFKKPTGAELKKIRNKFHLNRIQVNNLIHRLLNFRKGNITIASFKEVQEWYNTHKRTPTKEEFIQFSQRLDLGVNQVYALFRRAKDDQKGIITVEKRNFIHDYLMQCKSSNYDIDFLRRKTSLNKAQIRSIVYRIRNPNNELTDEIKDLIRHRMKGSNLASPSQVDEFVNRIQTETGLSRQQIRHLIRQFKYPLREFTPEKKKKLLHHLHETYGQNPEGWPKTDSEALPLENICDLSLRQILRIIRTHRSSHDSQVSI